MRYLAVVVAVAGCGGSSTPPEPDAADPAIVDCNAMGLPPTSVSGKVFAPNGTLPLFGVTVYAPVTDPVPPSDLVECIRCGDVSGGSHTLDISDEVGEFSLLGVPAGDNVKIAFESGKWRRTITVPHVEACTDTRLPAESTRLPRTQAEGHIPRIAIATGEHDALECLVRKLGLGDEITAAGGPGRVQLYAGNGAASIGPGAPTPLPSVQTLWNSAATLGAHDLVMLSCEGRQLGTPKTQAALDAMRAYADAGGRVFASHRQNIWIGGNFGDTVDPGSASPTQAAWSSVATWDRTDGDPGDPVIVDEVANPFGTAFATWLIATGATTMRGQLTQDAARRHHTARTLNLVRATRVITLNGATDPQAFHFTTPVGNPEVCGKVAFTDIHVSATSSSQAGTPFPGNCSGTALTPQEMALAWTFFDLLGCLRNFTLP